MKTFDLEKITRVEICTLPTPIQYLERLSKELDVKIWVKRDDLTGIALGGNKNRKMEYVLGDAGKKGADCIITEGTITSNHCLQAAAGAKKIGLDCEVVLSDASIGEKIPFNLFLQKLLGIKINCVQKSEERKNKMEERAMKLRKEGREPYIIPSGGSDKVGMFGYVKFMEELAEQSQEMNVFFDYFIHGAGSAGTQAGSIVGKKLFYPNLEIIGINAGYPQKQVVAKTKKIIQEFEKEYSLNLEIEEEEIVVLDDFIGAGYEVISSEVIKAVRLMAQLEGIFLDPVYNVKAMIGIMELKKRSYFKEEANILLLHSGGNQAFMHFMDQVIEKTG
jgi:D-cysteine desulfhydrase family pyridoxal phosphate-dependent enzyme